MNAAEMRKLRRMGGNLLKDRIRNECIYKKLELATIKDRMRRTGCDGWIR